jgi:hypothetical protein
MTILNFDARLTNQFDSVFINGEVKSPEKKYDVRILTSRTNNTVTLRDGTGANESVFLQGFKAGCFFNDFDRFGKECPHTPVVDALRILAAPHIAHWK